jgi:hypothetical protein
VSVAELRGNANTAQLLDDPACQRIDIASRVLLDRCDDDTLDLGLLSRIGHP